MGRASKARRIEARVSLITRSQVNAILDDADELAQRLEVAVKEDLALNAEVERLRAVAMRILAWTPVTEYDGGKAWSEGWNGCQEFVQSILRAALEVSEC